MVQIMQDPGQSTQNYHYTDSSTRAAGGGFSLQIDPTSLYSTGSAISKINDLVQSIYDDICGVAKAVSSTESWAGAARDSFNEHFEEADKYFEPKLESLDKLAPTIWEISDEYAATEAGNASRVM